MQTHDNGEIQRPILGGATMTRYTQHEKRWESRAGMDTEGDPEDQDGEVNTSIVLYENVDLKKYNAAYSFEKEKVTRVLGSLAANTLSENEDSSSDVRVVDIAGTWPDDAGARLFVPLKMQECVLHETGSQLLRSGDSRCHFYTIEDDRRTKLKFLSVTVVFTGVFEGAVYIPGKLSVELRRVSMDGAPPVPMGSSHSANTADSIGRVVVQHEGVINGDLYEVSVVADPGAPVNYSLALGGSFACPVATEVRREMACWIATRNEMAERKQQSHLVATTLLLLERKQALQERLWRGTREDHARIEAELEDLDLQMDRQDEMVDAEKQTVVRKIHELELDKGNTHRLFSLRSKFKENLSEEVRRHREEKGRLQIVGDALRKENEGRKEVLLVAAARLWGERVASRIMEQLQRDAGEDVAPCAGKTDV